LSITNHHPEFWRPAWGVRSALIALISFMPTKGDGAIGSLDYSEEERRAFAKKSRDWVCTLCGSKNSEVLPDETVVASQSLQVEEEIKLSVGDVTPKVEKTQENSIQSENESNIPKSPIPISTSNISSASSSSPSSPPSANVNAPSSSPDLNMQSLSTDPSISRSSNPSNSILTSSEPSKIPFEKSSSSLPSSSYASSTSSLRQRFSLDTIANNPIISLPPVTNAILRQRRPSAASPAEIRRRQIDTALGVVIFLICILLLRRFT